MKQSRITLFETTGETLSNFGPAGDGTETVVFQSTATVHREMQRTGAPATGFDEIATIIVYPTTYPDPEPRVGQRAEVTDRRGKTLECKVRMFSPSDALNSMIVLDPQ